MPNAATVLQQLLNPQALATVTQGTPQGVTVTQWTVGYDTSGNLTASCLVTPDAGVDISFCGIAVYQQDAAMTVIAAGTGGINSEREPGVQTVWGADAITGVYQQGHGTTVSSVVLGYATFSELRLFYFQQDFQL